MKFYFPKSFIPRFLFRMIFYCQHLGRVSSYQSQLLIQSVFPGLRKERLLLPLWFVITPMTLDNTAEVNLGFSNFSLRLCAEREHYSDIRNNNYLTAENDFQIGPPLIARGTSTTFIRKQHETTNNGSRRTYASVPSTSSAPFIPHPSHLQTSD